MRIDELTKKELVNRLKFKCKHHHNGVRHPQCYKDLLGSIERIGFLDIEATNLNADFGYILSYCILGDDNRLVKRRVSSEDIKRYRFDKPLMSQLCKDIREYDRVVVYYGKDYRFDLPFIRTRAEKYGLDFPGYRELVVTDVYDMAKTKLRLHRNRLQNVCEHLGIESKGHPLKPEIWQRANAGEEKALDYILTHNIEDVYSLKAVFDKLLKYVRLARTSI